MRCPWGLSVVHGIIQNHGGAIGVESTLGTGSTFKVFLPLVQGEDSEVDASAEVIRTGSEHILLVDDELALAKMMGKMLKGLGYKITIATSAQEASKTFKSDPEAYDLMITDMTMPDLTGAELAKETMKIRPEFPVIICTGYSDVLDESKAHAMGIRALLMKPVDRTKLSETLRQVLDGTV